MSKLGKSTQFIDACKDFAGTEIDSAGGKKVPDLNKFIEQKPF